MEFSPNIEIAVTSNNQRIRYRLNVKANTELNKLCLEIIDNRNKGDRKSA